MFRNWGFEKKKQRAVMGVSIAPFPVISGPAVLASADNFYLYTCNVCIQIVPGPEHLIVCRGI
jgi:hypothetical protein